MKIAHRIHAIRWWWLASWFVLAAGVAGCAEELPRTIKTVDGLPMAVESAGEGETAVVFIHGWTCNQAFWRDQIDAITGAGYRVVTLDLPGHGRSGTDRDAWSIAGLADDVARVIEVLDLPNVILVGHSMGALVSVATAPRRPGRVRGVVAVDMLQNVEFEPPEEAIEQFLMSFRNDFEGTRRFFFSMFFPPDADPELIAWIQRQSARSDPTAAMALMEDLVQLDEAALLAAAGVPVRAINAVPYGDMAIPTDIGINRKYADFDAVEMNGVGHFLQMERPAEFNLHLIAFLSELAGAE